MQLFCYSISNNNYHLCLTTIYFMTFLPGSHFTLQLQKQTLASCFSNVIIFIFLVAIFSAESRNILLKQNELQKVVCMLSVIVDTPKCFTLTGTNTFTYQRRERKSLILIPQMIKRIHITLKNAWLTLFFKLKNASSNTVLFPINHGPRENFQRLFYLPLLCVVQNELQYTVAINNIMQIGVFFVRISKLPEIFLGMLVLL